MRTTCVTNEDEINGFLDELNFSKKFDSSSLCNDKNKSYLKLKRKRSPYNNIKDDIMSMDIIEKAEKMKIKKMDSPQPQQIGIDKTIAFQNFSKNILSIIVSYLRIDDLLKLKAVGSRRLSLLINEIFEMMQKMNNDFVLDKIIKIKYNFINDYDSLLCKKYTMLNMYKKDLKINKSYVVKYALYHQLTNKNYYICHYLFYYYFCSSDVDMENDKFEKSGEDDDMGEERNGSMIDGENNVLFKLPSKDYYEKFQFLDEYKKGEIAIFSLQKILLYNIYTKKRDHNIFLSSSCDHIFYRKELKLLLVPIGYMEIEFFKIYASNRNIKTSNSKLNIGENGFEYSNMRNCVDILIMSDYVKHNNNNKNNNYNNLICTYCLGGIKIIIFDCKSMKSIKEITCKSEINNININNEYIIVFTEDKYINFYSINNNEYSFINNFNLNNICKVDNIKYLSLINSIYINNVFILFIHIPNKKIVKQILLRLEEKKEKKDFYYSCIPLKNEMSEHIFDEPIICKKLFIEKKGNESINKLNILVCDLKDKNKNIEKDNRLITEYSFNL